MDVLGPVLRQLVLEDPLEGLDGLAVPFLLRERPAQQRHRRQPALRVALGLLERADRVVDLARQQLPFAQLELDRQVGGVILRPLGVHLQLEGQDLDGDVAGGLLVAAIPDLLRPSAELADTDVVDADLVSVRVGLLEGLGQHVNGLVLVGLLLDLQQGVGEGVDLAGDGRGLLVLGAGLVDLVLNVIVVVDELVLLGVLDLLVHVVNALGEGLLVLALVHRRQGRQLAGHGLQLPIVGVRHPGKVHRRQGLGVLADSAQGLGEHLAGDLVGLLGLAHRRQDEVPDPVDHGVVLDLYGGLEHRDHVGDVAGVLGEEELGVGERLDRVLGGLVLHRLENPGRLASGRLALQRNFAQRLVPAFDVTRLAAKAVDVHLDGEIPITRGGYFLGALEKRLAFPVAGIGSSLWLTHLHTISK